MATEMLRDGNYEAPATAGRAAREPIGPCPNCDGQIVENTRAFGCTSWKSKKHPGCGFVIWKSQRGRGEVTREMAKEMLERGETELPETSSVGHSSSDAA